MTDQEQLAPLVTVVIPCYKQAHFLPEALASVLDQPEQRWEIIVIDDASPDVAAIQSVITAADDRRIALLHHDANRGLAAARNTGVRHSRTEYYVCVDADDKLHPRLLESLLTVAGSTGADVVITDYVTFGATEQRRACSVPSADQILNNQPLHPCGVLIRKALWDRIGGYDEAAILRHGREDWEFYIRLFHTGCKAVHCPEPLYLYRTYPGSMNLRCRRVEHLVRGYIYRKHRHLFDRQSRRNMLGTGFDRSASAALEDERRLSALFYAIRALGFGISTKRLRRCVESLPPSFQGLLRQLRRGLIRVLPDTARRTSI